MKRLLLISAVIAFLYVTQSCTVYKYYYPAKRDTVYIEKPFSYWQFPDHDINPPILDWGWRYPEGGINTTMGIDTVQWLTDTLLPKSLLFKIDSTTILLRNDSSITYHSLGGGTLINNNDSILFRPIGKIKQ